MNTFARKIITGLLLASAMLGLQAQAGIQTAAIGRATENLPPADAIKSFSSATPCYIKWSNDHPDAFSSVAKIFKDGGFNITNDDSATCTIEITGYITAPSQGSGSVPVNLLYVLSNAGKFKDIGPALQTANHTEAGKIADSASGIANEPIGANGLNVLSQTGGMVNGFHGSVAGTAIGALVDAFSGIHSRQETPSGVVYLNADVMFGGFFKRIAFAVGTYTASTTPETPETLINAGMKRLAQTIWEHTAAYDKANGVAFTTPIISATTPDANQMPSGTAQNLTAPTNEAVSNSPVGSIDKDAQKAITDTAQTADNGNAQK